MKELEIDLDLEIKKFEYLIDDGAFKHAEKLYLHIKNLSNKFSNTVYKDPILKSLKKMKNIYSFS